MFVKKTRGKLSYLLRMFCDSVTEITTGVVYSAVLNPIKHKECSVCRGSASVNTIFLFNCSVCYITWKESSPFYEYLCVSNCNAYSQYDIHSEGQCANNALRCSDNRTCSKCRVKTHFCSPGISLRAIKVKQLCIIQCAIDH